MTNKRYFSDLIKAFYAQDFQDMYNFIPNLSEEGDDEHYEKEVANFNKNGVESTVTVFFNKKGAIVGTVSTSTGSVNNNEAKLSTLKKKLQIALDDEDYLKADDINKKIKELQKPK